MNIGIKNADKTTANRNNGPLNIRNHCLNQENEILKTNEGINNRADGMLVYSSQQCQQLLLHEQQKADFTMAAMRACLFTREQMIQIRFAFNLIVENRLDFTEIIDDWIDVATKCLFEFSYSGDATPYTNSA